MARSKSNLTGTAFFEVVKLTTGPDGKKVEQVIGTFNSATPCNKESYAEVKRLIAAVERGKRCYQGRPDIGYTVSDVITAADGSKSLSTLCTIQVRMTDATAKKTWVGPAASLAAQYATLAPYVTKEQAKEQPVSDKPLSASKALKA